ncbi:MAG: prepilin-type N-terminal cleavage/methylation domain-containing protein [Armatimonadetes bacterium]|nr:prepilin-type N-terminal cleavage/methylation domain-containing protein [Armatimonadota bacterium]
MNRRGYTLIEILVVVGIIAIIVAILFPVFATVRENGRMAKCTSNLHQWGTAIQMYRDDWGGIDPEPGRRFRSLYEIGLPPVSEEYRFMAAYGLDAPGILHCPSSRGGSAYNALYLADMDLSSELLDAFEKRGGEMPMMACWQHNSEPKPSKNPTWAILRVIVLRLNQSVTVRWMPQQRGSSWTW